MIWTLSLMYCSGLNSYVLKSYSFYTKSTLGLRANRIRRGTPHAVLNLYVRTNSVGSKQHHARGTRRRRRRRDETIWCDDVHPQHGWHGVAHKRRQLLRWPAPPCWRRPQGPLNLLVRTLQLTTGYGTTNSTYLLLTIWPTPAQALGAWNVTNNNR